MVLDRIFGKAFGQLGQNEFIELDTADSDAGSGKVSIRVDKLDDFADSDRIQKSLREGAVVLVKIKALKDKDLSELKRAASGADMVFINVGLGGGTGTGAAPVIAQLAKESGAVVIAVATMPFDCEKARHEKAEFGLQELTEVVDTAILIDNNNIRIHCPKHKVQKTFDLGRRLKCLGIGCEKCFKNS